MSNFIDPNPERFIPAAEIRSRIDLGYDAAFGVSGSPECQIRLLPSEKRMEVLVKEGHSPSVVEDFENLEMGRVSLDNSEWNFVRISWDEFDPLNSYYFYCAVVDRVQLKGETLATAVDITLQEYRGLLRRRDSLSLEMEIGLFGEVLVLDALIDSIGVESSLDSWLGPLSEEHDFVLPEIDLEVKTTSSEPREHWISSVYQLRRTGLRPLSLLSIQVTKQTKELDCSLSLPELISKVRGKTSHRTSDFEDRLKAVGFYFEPELYKTRWALRTPILEFAVDDNFPKITPEELNLIKLTDKEIRDIRYKLSLQDREPSDPTLLVKWNL